MMYDPLSVLNEGVPVTIGGCVPCYNNESTIAESVRSLLAQTAGPIEVFVIDDGSTDASVQRAEEAGARVISLDSNQGRGAARAKAVKVAAQDLVLSVDGTAVLAPDFAEKTLPWFEDSKVAAVYGRITQLPARKAVDRWRGRHLYRVGEGQMPKLTESLITWGLMLRRSAVLEVGNFDASLRHSEDLELGQRLLAAGWKIGYEPSAMVTTLISNSLGQVLERYWRWYGGAKPVFSFRHYARTAWYSLKVLAWRDLRSGDLPCAAISAILPHYCAYRTLRGR